MKRPAWLDKQWQQLLDNAKGGRLGHAIMFSGPQGVGKHLLARDLRLLALCGEGQVPACGKCRSCEVAVADNHPDDHALLVPGDKSVIGIEQVRTLIQDLTLSPTYNNRKVGLVMPAEAMTNSAANALLKTLEEPPGSTLMILVSHESWRLPATIISRCQIIQCGVPDKEKAVSWLQDYCGEPEWDVCLALAGGAPLQAIEYKKQKIETLYESIIEDLISLRTGRGDIVSVANRWADKHLPVRLRSLYLILRLLALENFEIQGELAHKSTFRSLHKAAGDIKLSALMGYQDAVLKTRAKLESPLNPQLMLENLLAPWVSGFKKYELEQMSL